MGIFSQANFARHTSARRVLWTSLVFSLVSGMVACSSQPLAVDDTTESLDEALVSSEEASQPTIEDSGEFRYDESSAPVSAVEEYRDPPESRYQFKDPLFGTRRAPRVQAQPFQTNGVIMNAYLFVRSPEESWESLSQLIYGRSDRADMIASWNQRGTLAVGRVIYYNSAARPDDMATMKVLAEDFGIALTQITIKAGDSLSQIAQETYGSAQLWKEIAALNPQIESPDIIQIGQSVLIQPAQIDTKAALEQLIAQSPGASSPSEVIENTNIEDAETSSANAAMDSPEPAPLPEIVTNQAPATEPPYSIANVMNPGTIITLAGILLVILGLGGVFLRRRIQSKKALQQSWSENENVTKLTPPKSAG